MSDILNILSYFTIGIAVIIALVYLSKYKSRENAYRYFTIYLAVVAVVQLSAVIVGTVYHMENLVLYHVYYLSQFVILSYFYYAITEFKFIKWVMVGVLLFLGIQYALNPSLFFKYHPTGTVITQSVLAVYCLIYFYKSLTKAKGFLILNTGVFQYIVSSILIFASGNLVFDKSVNELVTTFLHDMNVILYLVFQILICIEWYRYYKRPVH